MVGGYFLEQDVESMSIDFGGGGWGELSPWPPLTWHHICLTFNHTTGIVQIVNQEGLSWELVRERDDSTIRMKSVTIMKQDDNEQREEGGLDSFSMVGRLTDLNVWNTTFSEENMIEWLGCKNSSQGNILAWETSLWILENLTESQVSMYEICKPEIFLIFAKETALTSNKVCEHLGGHLFYATTNDSINKALAYKSENSEICSEDLGSPLHLDRKTNIYVNKLTGKSVDPLNWARGYPYKGVGYRCISINEEGKYQTIGTLWLGRVSPPQVDLPA